MQKLQELIFSGYISKHSTFFYEHISIQIFCTVFICFVFDDVLKSICFRTLCSKHLDNFKNTYQISCWFHCDDMLYIKFRSSETFAVIKSVTRISMVGTLYKFKAIECWFTLYSHMYVLGCSSVNSNVFFISRFVFLRVAFHWYLHCSK